MAIYHFSAQVIGRSKGRSAIAAAAYRSAERLMDRETGEVKDYTRKDRVDFEKIYAPENAPDWATDRQELWNKVHEVEKRKDAQLCREINLALPCELTAEQNQELLKAYVKSQFVEHGMVADVAMHNLKGENPHAHIMLTMRPLEKDGFGKKERSWNQKEQLEQNRARWAELQNLHLDRAGELARVDHRSLEAQGIDRQPQIHRGYNPAPERIERYEDIRRANRELKGLVSELQEIEKKVEGESKIEQKKLERNKKILGNYHARFEEAQQSGFDLEIRQTKAAYEKAVEFYNKGENLGVCGGQISKAGEEALQVWREEQKRIMLKEKEVRAISKNTKLIQEQVGKEQKKEKLLTSEERENIKKDNIFLDKLHLLHCSSSDVFRILKDLKEDLYEKKTDLYAITNEYKSIDKRIDNMGFFEKKFNIFTINKVNKRLDELDKSLEKAQNEFNEVEKNIELHETAYNILYDREKPERDRKQKERQIELEKEKVAQQERERLALERRKKAKTRQKKKSRGRGGMEL